MITNEKRENMRENLVEKVFCFEFTLPADHEGAVSSTEVYAKINSLVETRRAKYANEIESAAFQCALEFIVVEFIRWENHSAVGAHYLTEQLSENINNLSNEQLQSLCEYFGVFRERQSDISADITTALSTIVGLLFEVHLERLRIYLRYGLSDTKWLELFPSNSEETRENNLDIIHSILGD